MKLSDLGEFGMIKRFSKKFMHDLGQGIAGIGDDAAIIRNSDKESFVVTTDMLVEGVHFLRDSTKPEMLGHKSLAVNISDIAAMGARPLYAFLSIALPSNLDITWIDAFFDGFASLAERYNVKLLGGDTTKSKGAICINVCLIGTGHTSQLKLRSAARPGDVVCVTGTLGDSAAGLKILLEETKFEGTEREELIQSHVRPWPHLEQGLWLGQQPGVHAMMDVSDGVASDIWRILERSNCGAVIETENLPISYSLKKVCNLYQWNSVELAIAGGEDYCLLCTINPPTLEEISLKFSKHFSTQLFPIGRITDRANFLEYQSGGQSVTLDFCGYDHFRTGGRK